MDSLDLKELVYRNLNVSNIALDCNTSNVLPSKSLYFNSLNAFVPVPVDHFSKSLYNVFVSGAECRKLIMDSFNCEDFEGALNYAKLYADDCAKKIILLKDKNTNKYVPVPYLTRFASAYVRKIRSKLSVLYSFKGSIAFLTLTVPHLKSISDTHCLLKKAIPEFMRVMRSYFGFDVKYFGVEEISKPDNEPLHIHSHLLLFNMGFLSPKELAFMKLTWHRLTGSEYLFYEYENNMDNARKIVKYILKYVLKTAGLVNITSAFHFAIKSRGYFCSKGLLPADDNKQASKYVFVGCGYANVLLSRICASECDFSADVIEFFGNVFKPDNEPDNVA